MKDIKKSFIRMIVYILVFAGICVIWEVADVAMYGESQHSTMDLLAAFFMASWLDNRIWGN